MVNKFGKQWVEKLNRFLYYRTYQSLYKMSVYCERLTGDMMYFSREAFFSLRVCALCSGETVLYTPLSKEMLSMAQRGLSSAWVTVVGCWGRWTESAFPPLATLGPTHCVMGAALDSTQPCSMTDGCQGELSELNNLDTPVWKPEVVVNAFQGLEHSARCFTAGYPPLLNAPPPQENSRSHWPVLAPLGAQMVCKVFLALPWEPPYGVRCGSFYDYCPLWPFLYGRIFRHILC